jgi:hypothetical protein
MQVWVSGWLAPDDLQDARQVHGNDPNLTFTRTHSEEPILRIVTSLELWLLPSRNEPFMTFSPFALSQMKSSHIDPFTFRESVFSSSSAGHNETATQIAFISAACRSWAPRKNARLL